jgi:hypothetical protein
VVVLSNSGSGHPAVLIDQAHVAYAFSVQDGALTPTGLSFSARTNQATSTLVATFTDAAQAAQPGEFSGTILWGNGQSSSATITAEGAPNTFDVYGVPSYTTAGTFSNVSISLTDRDGATATANVTANPLTGSNVVPSATEGIAFHGTVATFQHSTNTAIANTITATIAWGDGHTS